MKSLTGVFRDCPVCGQKFYVYASNAVRGKGNHCSKPCFIVSQKGRKFPNRKKSDYRGEKHHWFGRDVKREKNPFWVADRTKLAKANEHRNSPAHREWSLSVKNRDGWKCKMSNGDCSGQIVAHHILPWRDYENLRYELNNGITLCKFHHPRKRVDELRLSPYFQSLLINETLP